MLRKLILAAACLAALTGCLTGERPYFSSEPCQGDTATGDATIDAMIAQLRRADSLESGFSATYHALLRFGNVETDVAATSITQSQSVTVRSTRFLNLNSNLQTCDLTTGVCSEGHDETRISDTGLTAQFYGNDAAQRLCRDAQSKIGPVTASPTVIAGQASTCIDVVVTGGTVTYCTVDNGPLARLVDADVAVELTGYSPQFDPTQMTSTD